MGSLMRESLTSSISMLSEAIGGALKDTQLKILRPASKKNSTWRHSSSSSSSSSRKPTKNMPSHKSLDEILDTSSYASRVPKVEDIQKVQFKTGTRSTDDGRLILVNKEAFYPYSLSSRELSKNSDASDNNLVCANISESVSSFIRDVLLSDEFLGKKPPKLLISVTGATTPLNIDPRLEKIFGQGIEAVAKSTTAWIASAGVHAGVTRLLGEAKRKFETDVPLIAFTTFSKINHHDKIQRHLDKQQRENQQQEMKKEPIFYDTRVPVEKLDESDRYESETLNPDHTHFVLVKSTTDEWGQEISLRCDFEQYMREKDTLLCLVVVSGGIGTIEAVAQSVKRGFSVVLFEGTLRAADYLANKKKINFAGGPSYTDWSQFIRPGKENKDNRRMKSYMNDIKRHANNLYIYSVGEDPSNPTVPFDRAILQAVMGSKDNTLVKKLCLAVEWNRDDIATLLLDDPRYTKSRQAAKERSEAISAAVGLALKLNKPVLYQLLIDKGAERADIKLAELYTETADILEKYRPHCVHTFRKALYTGVIAPFTKSDDDNGTPPTTAAATTSRTVAPLATASVSIFVDGIVSSDSEDLSPREPANKGIHFLSKPAKEGSQKLLKKPKKEDAHTETSTRTVEEEKKQAFLHLVERIFASAGPVFEEYSTTIKNKFGGTKARHPETEKGKLNLGYTDAMLWAILTSRFELAKVLWEQTRCPVHSALTAAGLCRSAAHWLLNEREAFLEVANWFEETAASTLKVMEYRYAKELLLSKRTDFELHNVLQIAVRTNCQDFVADHNVQRYLDELLYHDKHGGIPPGTRLWKVLSCMFMPFLLNITNTYKCEVEQTQKKKYTGSWHHFYLLPYTKFWATTLFYVGYLCLLAYVLASEQSINITIPDLILWTWMVAYAVEEWNQFRRLQKRYFRFTSNIWDMIIIVLQICYVSLSVASAILQEEIPVNTNFLIVVTIISYLRLMNVFSFSKDLGPLYVVFQRIIWDVIRWLFIFVLFAVSFQVSFMALNAQIPNAPNKWTPSIDGGSFAGAFYTIIGDWQTTMAVFSNSVFGSILVSVYAIIAQIALVNVLIAMMGASFDAVSETSYKEWKYSRYDLIEQYASTSFLPPPLSLLLLPYWILTKVKKAVWKKNKMHIGKVTPENEGRSETFRNRIKNIREGILQSEKKEEMNWGNLKQEMKSILESYKVRVESTTLLVKEKRISITWSPHINQDIVNRILYGYKHFIDWAEHNTANIAAVHIIDVEYFENKICLVRLCSEEDSGKEKQDKIEKAKPSHHNFTIESAIAILIVLEVSDQTHKRKYTVVIKHPRYHFQLLPGVVEGGRYLGKAVSSLVDVGVWESTHVDDLDLKFLGDQDQPHINNSNGDGNPIPPLYLSRKAINQQELDELKHNMKSSDLILEIVSLSQLKKSMDAKALLALSLYKQLSQN